MTYRGYMIIPKFFSTGSLLRALFVFAAILFLPACSMHTPGSAALELQPVSSEVEGLVSAGATETGSANWDTHLHDALRSNISTSLLTPPIKSAWQKRLVPFMSRYHWSKPILNSSPAISGDVLFAGSEDGVFYAFDIRSGSIIWQFQADGAVDSTPTLSESMVCFGTGSGKLYCLDRNIGSELWSYSARTEIISSPVISGERIFFTSSNQKLYALDSGSGEKLWVYARPTHTVFLPRFINSPALGSGKLFVLFQDGELVCLDSVKGEIVWTNKLLSKPLKAGTIRKTPLVAGSNVYAIDGNGNVLGFDIETGEVIGGYSAVKAIDFIVDKTTIYVAGETAVVALDAATGSASWTRTLDDGRIPRSMFATSRYLFVLYNKKETIWGLNFLTRKEEYLQFLKLDRGYIEAISLDNGSVVWTKRFKTPFLSNGAVSTDSIAFISPKGILRVFSAR